MKKHKIQAYGAKTITVAVVLAVALMPGAGAHAQVDADIEARGQVGVDIETSELRVQAGESVTLEAPQSQDDGQVRSFTWTQVGGPFQLDVSGEGSVSVTPPVAGIYEFELVVQSDGEERVEKRVTVVVGASAQQPADSPDFLDPDDDDDGVSRDREDQATPLLRTGISIQGRLCAQEEDCNDSGETASAESSQQLRVQVSGAQVRGWDPERKAQVQARVQAAGEASSANDFGIQVASAALENETISEISSDDQQTEVRYETTVRLFGFIPINTQATARADAQGEARIDYPWYAFLASKSDQSVMANLAADIRASHDVLISVE